MKGFDKVVREIRWAVAQVLLIPLLLNGVIVFLLFYIPLAYFNQNTWLALIPAFLFVVFLAFKHLRMNKLKLVERYYPHLNEKLRTAADYAYKSGVMVDQLHQEVIKDVKKVATSAFVSRKALVKKSVAVILLSFIVLSVTHFNLDSEGFKLKIKEKIAQATDKVLFEEGKSIFNNTFEQRGGSGVGVGINSDIFGKQQLAKLGDEEIDVKISPASVEFKIGKVEDAEKKDFQSVFPEEVFLEQSKTYEEKIPREQQELVKKYFKDISSE